MRLFPHDTAWLHFGCVCKRSWKPLATTTRCKFMQCLTVSVLYCGSVLILYLSISVLVWTQLGWNWEWTCVPARCLLGQSDEHVSPPRERQISKAVKTGCPCSHSCSDHFLLQRSKVTVCDALPGQHAGSLGGEDVWVETGKMEELKKKRSALWLSLCVRCWSAGSENCQAIKYNKREFYVIVCFYGVRYQKNSFTENHYLSISLAFGHLSVAHSLFIYLRNLIMCFIMHSISSMQRHNIDGWVIALYNLQNHNYHFCVFLNE